MLWKQFQSPFHLNALLLMAALWTQTCFITCYRAPNSIKLPEPRLLCVPQQSQTEQQCFKIELQNLHAIPEENRVLFLLGKLRADQNPPPLRYESIDHWQCIFPTYAQSTNIVALYPKTIGPAWNTIGNRNYNHLALAQCDLPQPARYQSQPTPSLICTYPRAQIL